MGVKNQNTKEDMTATLLKNLDIHRYGVNLVRFEKALCDGVLIFV